MPLKILNFRRVAAVFLFAPRFDLFFIKSRAFLAYCHTFDLKTVSNFGAEVVAHYDADARLHGIKKPLQVFCKGVEICFKIRLKSDGCRERRGGRPIDK